MRAFCYLSLFAAAYLVAARSPQHVGKRFPKPATRIEPRIEIGHTSKEPVEKLAPRHLNVKTKSSYCFLF